MEQAMSHFFHLISFRLTTFKNSKMKAYYNLQPNHKKRFLSNLWLQS